MGPHTLLCNILAHLFSVSNRLKINYCINAGTLKSYKIELYICTLGVFVLTYNANILL